MPNEIAFADTNLFVRIFTEDDPEQTAAVHNLLKRVASGNLFLVTNHMCLAEIVWVLESSYAPSVTREMIRKSILSMVNTAGIEIREVGLKNLAQALNLYLTNNIDYIDAYNAAWMQEQNINIIYTFDRKHYGRVQGLDVRVPNQER